LLLFARRRPNDPARLAGRSHQSTNRRKIASELPTNRRKPIEPESDIPNPKNQPDNTPSGHNNPELPRYEEVLLCAPGEDKDKPVTFVHTLKWMETVQVARKDGAGDEYLGFLVTVPKPTGPGANRIFSHICRDLAAHARAVADLEKDRPEKEHSNGSLPAVWNGKFAGCPLCNTKQGEQK